MKKHFRRKRAQLKGARKLRSDGKPFFVHNTCSGLTEVNLELKQGDFPKILVGSHADISEILLRQILLQGFYKLCPAVMRSIGSGKPFKYPLPNKWVKHITDNGVPSSFLISRIYLLLSSLKRVIIGFAKFCILLSQKMNPVNPGCSYAVFLGLQQNNLPDSNFKKTYDIISWYNKSSIKKPNIRKIWAQAKVKESYIAPAHLIVSPSVFPRLNHINRYLQFLFKGFAALIVAVFGIFRGKWWYGHLYPDAINFHYVHALKREFLAEDYFFHNSGWCYKPLWTYEAEKKGSIVSLYYYSTNMENFQFNNHKKNESYGLKIMTWNHFIVWDQQQENYLKQFFPAATFVQTWYVDFTGIEFIPQLNNGAKRLAVFDVTPTRPITYTRLGYAIPPYYSEKLNLAFLKDIIETFNNGKWEILWKRKRIVDNKFISEAFNRKQLNLVENKVKVIYPGVAARSLVELSDAVVSMPFTSTSLLAKAIGIPSAYYDTSGKIQQNKSHGIYVIKNISELSKWESKLSGNPALSII